jgi:hypothetical protein
MRRCWRRRRMRGCWRRRRTRRCRRRRPSLRSGAWRNARHQSRSQTCSKASGGWPRRPRTHGTRRSWRWRHPPGLRARQRTKDVVFVTPTGVDFLLVLVSCWSRTATAGRSFGGRRRRLPSGVQRLAVGGFDRRGFSFFHGALQTVKTAGQTGNGATAGRSVANDRETPWNCALEAR